MRPTTTLSLVCLLLTLWTAVMTAIMLFSSGPEEQEDSKSKRSLRDMEIMIDKYDSRNRYQLTELQREISELKVALHNHTRSFHQEKEGSQQAQNKETDQQQQEGDHDTTDTEDEPNPAVSSSSQNLVRVNASFDNQEPIVVLLIACNRESVKRAIDSLLNYRPSEELFPIVVSQDCDHEGTSKVIDSYGDKLSHIMQPDQSDFPLKGKERKMKGYFKIARHYKWALGQVFDIYGYNYAVVVEDDLEVAPDFFSYFQATRPLLATDKKLWCVSAWNDNGKEMHIDRKSIGKLYRTDFFPGLGWMLTVQLWHELKEKWPISYWDDWMRKEEQRKGRACIRPEISRTHTFGKKGVSKGQYYELHLKYIVLNEDQFDFLGTDLNYLLEPNYEKVYVEHVLSLPVVTLSEVLHSRKREEVQIKYSSIKEFQSFAKHLKIMSDLRAKIPRTAYKGIVSFRRGSRRIHLTPVTWTSYQDL